MQLNPKVMVLASFSTIIPVFLYLCNVFSYEDLAPSCLGIFTLVCIIQWYSYDSPDMALFLEDTSDNELLQENNKLTKELKQVRELLDTYKQQNTDLLAIQQYEPLGEVLKRRVSHKPPPPPAPPRTCVGKHKYGADGKCKLCDQYASSKGVIYCSKHGHSYGIDGVCMTCGRTAPNDFFISSRKEQLSVCSDHGHMPDKYGARCKRCGCAVA